MELLTFALVTAGLWLLIPARIHGIYRPAVLAIRHRAPKPPTQTEVAVQRIAIRLEPYIDMDPIKRGRLAEILTSLGHSETPEIWQARALARALLFSGAMLTFMVVSPIFGVGGSVLVGVAVYQQQNKTLTGEMAERRQRIERELPQFASTIRQQLNNTHDVVAILDVYRKICGQALQGEITRTLNDMVTGNPERALKALEGRVSSPKLGQVVRGLIAVLRGDDQRAYFDMLAMEFRSAQNEAVEKELLKRPNKLNPYMALLFGGICLMIAASLGTFIIQQIQSF